MKRIIIFNSGAFIYGAEKGLIHFIKALNNNFEITIALPHKGPLESKLKELFGNIHIKTLPLAILKSSLSPFYYINFFFFSIVNTIYFLSYVIRENIDIICTNNLLLIFPSIVAKLTKKRHIWFVREFLPVNSLNLILGRFITKFSNEIICQSETIKDKLSLISEGRVIYEPIDLGGYKIYEPKNAKRDLNLPLNSIIISIISRIHPCKGQYEFLKKFKNDLKKSDDIFLIIAGDTSLPTSKNRLYKRKIEEFIEKNHLKNVKLLGFREDIDKILSLSDICVFPFLREEPFGIAVTEALAFGKITFFPKRGGLKEVYKIFNRGEDFDAKKIVETISFLKKNPSRKPAKLYIPDILSFQNYKNEIVSLFKE